MNRNHALMMKRTAAGALAAVLGFSTAACGTASTAGVKKDTDSMSEEAEREALSTALTSAGLSSSGDSAEKVETVYVTAGADGSKQDVIVSDWLRNYAGAEEIKDTTDLTDIENVKGDENFTENGDGTVTWQAGGNDIYYQGKTTAELPVSVKISYKLDGNDISADELAGKSGRVTMRFDYTNTAKKTVTVNGKDEEVTVPFAMITGMILPDSNFSNIQVTNGTVVSDANSNIVVGAAVPGLKDALGINEKKLDDLGIDTESSIPEYVEVTADVKDFKLGMTMTMASSDVLSGLGFSDLDNSDASAKIQDDMDALTSAMQQLRDGSGSLADGAGSLKNGTAQLKSGTGALLSGTSSIRDAIRQYTAGTEQLTAGLTNLNNSLGALGSGASQLSAGADALQSGLSSTFQAYKLVQATLGTGTYQSVLSLSDLSKQAAALQSEYAGVQAAAAEAVSTLGQDTVSQVTALVKPSLLAADPSIDDATAQTVTAYALDLLMQDGKTADLTQALTAYATAAASGDAATAQAVAAQAGAVLTPYVTKAAGELTSLQTRQQALTTSAGALTGGSESAYTAAETAAKQAYAGIAAAGSLDATQQAWLSTTGMLREEWDALLQKIAYDYASGNTADLQTDAAEYTAKLQVFNAEYQAMVGGAGSLESGVTQLSSGLKSLDAGINGQDPTGKNPGLIQAVGMLLSGAKTLTGNDKALNSGADTLLSGVRTAGAGVDQLDSGAGQLSDGAGQLRDGIVRLDEEGIQKLSEAFDGDINAFSDRLESIDEAAKAYDTFSGVSDDMTANVKFVIETAGIDGED